MIRVFYKYKNPRHKEKLIIMIYRLRAILWGLFLIQSAFASENDPANNIIFPPNYNASPIIKVYIGGEQTRRLEGKKYIENKKNLINDLILKSENNKVMLDGKLKLVIPGLTEDSIKTVLNICQKEWKTVSLVCKSWKNYMDFLMNEQGGSFAIAQNCYVFHLRQLKLRFPSVVCWDLSRLKNIHHELYDDLGLNQPIFPKLYNKDSYPAQIVLKSKGFAVDFYRIDKELFAIFLFCFFGEIIKYYIYSH